MVKKSMKKKEVTKRLFLFFSLIFFCFNSADAKIVDTMRHLKKELA